MDKLPKDPSLLAFLVNESRSRRPDLSGDDAARYWVRKPLLQSVANLWDDFAKTVYPNDDIELSVRNSFFRIQLTKLMNEQPSGLFNIASGLTSYPYYLDPQAEYFEFDTQLMVDFKTYHAPSVVKNANLEERSIRYLKIDIEKSELSCLEHEMANFKKRKILLLEGISYYLTTKQWRGLLSTIHRYCDNDDVVLFDFWHEKDARRVVFSRFRQFVKRHTSKDIERFNFLSLNAGTRYNGFFVAHVTDVYEQELNVRKTIMVNDDAKQHGENLRNLLHENSPHTMPERYAKLVMPKFL